MSFFDAGFGFISSKSVVDAKVKIPTARQVQKMLKDDWHKWTAIEKMVAAIVLLPEDVSTCIEDPVSTQRRLGDKSPDDLDEFREKARKRLEYLDKLLEMITIDIENYDDYSNGKKKATGDEEIPPAFAWTLKRRNDFARLCGFIHEIDCMREYEKTGPITIHAPKSLFKNKPPKKE